MESRVDLNSQVLKLIEERKLWEIVTVIDEFNKETINQRVDDQLSKCKSYSPQCLSCQT